ncbi:MAG: hypothetical protein JST54_13085 [Deltaproteobacteria bacterium]|nr:hypothetical protein [Deltaproteobacteria bacterium]
MLRRALLPLVALGLLLAPGSAFAAQDWFASVYSPQGVEVRADERLFTLFAVMNALGYDDAPVVRQYPVARREFSHVRAHVRQALASLDPKLKEQMSAFFDEHPLALGQYVAYTAQLGPAPQFAAPASVQPAQLQGFEKQLAAVYQAAKIHELFAEVQEAYRADTKAYLALVDEPLGKARKILRDPAGRAIVAVNDLDGRGAAQAVPVGADALLVLGPSPKPDVQAVVRAYARLVLDPILAKRGGVLKGAAEQAAVVRVNGGPALESASDFASELLARAIAIKVASTDPAGDEEAQLKLGFAGIKEAVRAVDTIGKPDRPLEQVVPDVLAGIELRKK